MESQPGGTTPKQAPSRFAARIASEDRREAEAERDRHIQEMRHQDDRLDEQRREEWDTQLDAEREEDLAREADGRVEAEHTAEQERSSGVQTFSQEYGTEMADEIKKGQEEELKALASDLEYLHQYEKKMQKRGEERTVKVMRVEKATAKGDRTGIRQLAHEVHKQKKQVERRIIREARADEETELPNSGKEEDKEESDAPRMQSQGEQHAGTTQKDENEPDYGIPEITSEEIAKLVRELTRSGVATSPRALSYRYCDRIKIHRHTEWQ